MPGSCSQIMPLAVRSCHYQASGRRRRRSSGHNRVAGSERGSCWWLVTPAASQTRAPSEAMTAIAAGHLLTCPAGQNAIADAVIRATQARRCVVWLMTRNASPARSPGHRAPGTCPAGATSAASCTIRLAPRCRSPVPRRPGEAQLEPRRAAWCAALRPCDDPGDAMAAPTQGVRQLRWHPGPASAENARPYDVHGRWAEPLGQRTEPARVPDAGCDGIVRGQCGGPA